MLKFLSINIIAELICFLTACLCLFKDKQAAWRSMTLFLLLTCMTEIAGKIMGDAGKNNDWVYNFYIIAEAVFTLWLFQSLICEYKKKSRLFGLAFSIFSVLYLSEIILHGITVFNNITTTCMSILFICLGLYYFYLLISDHQDLDLAKHAPFWWVTGTLCFYYCSSVSELYFTIFKSSNEHLFTYRHFVYIILNVILYGCWSYSFICRYLQRKSTH